MPASIFRRPFIPANRVNRLLMVFAICAGVVFIVASFAISVVAFDSVQKQQTFMCSLIGKSIVQQKASLQLRANSLQVFADHDTSAFIRAYETKQAATAREQASNFLDPTAISKALGGRCASDINKAQAQTSK